MKEIVINKKVAYEGKLLHVESRDVELEDGTKAYREVALKKSGIVIIPVHNNEIYLVKQYRAGIEDELLELPAGLIEDNEDIIASAHRELQEEIHMDFKDGTYLGTYYSSPAFTDEANTFVLARELFPSYKQEDFDERIEIIKLPLDVALENLHQNKYHDLRLALGLSLLENINSRS